MSLLLAHGSCCFSMIYCSTSFAQLPTKFRLLEEERVGDTDLEPRAWRKDLVGDHVCSASVELSLMGAIARSSSDYDREHMTAMGVEKAKLLQNRHG